MYGRDRHLSSTHHRSLRSLARSLVYAPPHSPPSPPPPPLSAPHSTHPARPNAFVGLRPPHSLRSASYLFYAVNLFASGLAMPFPLFWLRYSLFMILYPSGITGELLQFWASFPDTSVATPMWYRFAWSVVLSYSFAGPFMVMNMWGNRKSQFKRRVQLANPRPLNGLVWPVQVRACVIFQYSKCTVPILSKFTYKREL